MATVLIGLQGRQLLWQEVSVCVPYKASSYLLSSGSEFQPQCSHLNYYVVTVLTTLTQWTPHWNYILTTHMQGGVASGRVGNAALDLWTVSHMLPVRNFKCLILNCPLICHNLLIRLVQSMWRHSRNLIISFWNFLVTSYTFQSEKTFTIRGLARF